MITSTKQIYRKIFFGEKNYYYMSGIFLSTIIGNVPIAIIAHHLHHYSYPILFFSMYMSVNGRGDISSLKLMVQ